jgi:hypothetical protein
MVGLCGNRLEKQSHMAGILFPGNTLSPTLALKSKCEYMRFFLVALLCLQWMSAWLGVMDSSSS